jgi:hypothetical protein
MWYVYSCYKKELVNISETPKELFRNDNLFLVNYGLCLRNDIYSLPFNEKMSDTEIDMFIKEANLYIKNEISEIYGENTSSHRIVDLQATELNSHKETRSFLKMVYSGRRGATASNFIFFNKVGKSVSMYLYTYTVGIAQWWDIAYFILVSPLTILFWISRWRRGEYNIRTSIAQGIENSFEEQDIKSYIVSSNERILYSLKDFLKSKGLLTEEMLSIITNNITNINNGNQIVGGNRNSITSKLK